MEGRDIGTKVFPDAEVKIFLDAARLSWLATLSAEPCSCGKRSSGAD